MRASCATAQKSIFFFPHGKYNLSQKFFARYIPSFPVSETHIMRDCRLFFLDFLERRYFLYCQERLSLIRFKRSLYFLVFFRNDWISRIPCFSIPTMGNDQGTKKINVLKILKLPYLLHFQEWQHFAGFNEISYLLKCKSWCRWPLLEILN